MSPQDTIENIENQNNIKEKIMILCIALLAGFLLCEVITRIYFSQADQTIGASEEEICNKNVYQKVSNLSDPYRFSPYFPDYMEYWEYYGIRPKANWKEGNVEQNVVLPDGRKAAAIVYDMNTNGQHMRGVRDYSYKKDPDTLRIAVLGDSFTWGDDVPLFFSYPEIIAELIPNAEVLNFGLTATGIDAMYFRWKYEALTFHPDVVIFGIYIDDIRRAYSCITKPTLSVEEGELVITNMPPPSLQEIYESYEEPKTYSYFIDFLLYQIRYIGGVKKKQYEQGFTLLEPILREVQEQSAKDGTYFMVLVIERGNDYINDEAELAAIEQLKGLLERMKVPYTSANAIFANENFAPTDYIQGRFYHFMPEGYGILAQGVINKLEEDAIISEQKDYFFAIDKYEILVLTNKEDPLDKREIAAFRLFIESFE